MTIFYTVSGAPVVQSRGASKNIRDEFALIQTAFASVSSKLGEIVSVTDYGATGDGTTDDTAAINSAIAAVGAAGGGTVYIPAGTYRLTDSNPGAVSWDDNRALYVAYDNIRIVGDGIGSTILTLANSADCHVLQVGQRTASTLPIDNFQISNIEINGNRLNQTQPTAANDHWSGIYFVSNSTNITVRDMFIHDVQYYGIGFQRDGFVNCRVEDCRIEDTGADGIDFKMDVNASGFGNYIRGVVVSRPGLNVTALGGLLTAQAGIDVRHGVDVSDCIVTEIGADVTGVRINANIDNGSTYRSTITNAKCYSTGGTSSKGFQIGETDAHVVNCYTSGAEAGFWVRSIGAQFVNCRADDGTTGIYIYAAALEAIDNNSFINCGVTGNTNGVYLGVAATGGIDNTEFVSLSAVGNTSNVVIASADATNTRFSGGEIDGSISDSGTGTRALNTLGLGSRLISSGSDPTLEIRNTGTGDSLLIEDSASPDSTPFVITSLGRVVVGKDATVASASGTALVSFSTTNLAHSSHSHSADTVGLLVDLTKSRHATPGSHTIVQSGDDICQLRFCGSDGTNYIRAAAIIATSDGTPGTNDMPGRLVLSTTADGASSPTERVRIDSTGKVTGSASYVAHSATAIPAGGTAGAGLMVSSTANFGVFFGSGAPTLSAAKGSLYLRSDGSTTNDRMYVNTNGSTTWTAVTTAA